jgi:hypothetical protein
MTHPDGIPRLNGVSPLAGIRVQGYPPVNAVGTTASRQKTSKSNGFA